MVQDMRVVQVGSTNSPVNERYRLFSAVDQIEAVNQLKFLGAYQGCQG